MLGSAIRIAAALFTGSLLLPDAAVAQSDEVSSALKGAPTGRRFQITPQLGLRRTSANGPDLSFGGRLSYAPNPDVAFDVFGSYVIPSDPNDPYLLSKLQIRTAPENAIRTELLWVVGVGAWWRPIYGALAFEEHVVGRFRVGLGAGVAIGATRALCTNGLSLDPNRGFPVAAGDDGTVCNPFDAPGVGPSTNPRYYEPTTVRPMGVLGLAFELELLTHLSFRLEVRDYLFVSRLFRPDDEPALDDAVVHRVFVQLGLGIPF